MHIEIHPKVQGIAAERLLDFAGKLANDDRRDSDPGLLPALVEQGATCARRTSHLNGQTKAYEACIRLLADLRTLKWRVRADTYGIELVSSRRSHPIRKDPDSIRASKAPLRRELSPALDKHLPPKTYFATSPSCRYCQLKSR